MNSGVCSYCFNRLFLDKEIDVAGAIRHVAEKTEADCYEPLSRYWDPKRDEMEQAQEARNLLDEVGLRVSCYTLDSDFAVYDDEASQECVEICVARLEVAQILGTERIRLDPRSTLPGAPEDTDFDDVLERMAISMQQIADAAASVGIVVGVENHGRHLGRIAQTERLVQLVDRGNFGVNIDPTNFRAVFGEDHLKGVRRLAGHVVHVHLKDLHISTDPVNDDSWREAPGGGFIKNAVGGEGDADWPQIVRILRDAGYDDTLSLEIVDPDDILGSITTGVRNLNRVIRDS